MIFVLHGDDVVASRKRLSEITSEFKNVTYIDAEKASKDEILLALNTRDMFTEGNCVVIEKALKLPIEILESVDPSIAVVLWHNAELSKTSLLKFKNVKIESFMLPKLFFTFLDGLYPHNVKSELDLLSNMQNVEAEQIFYAMVKRVRQLLALKKNLNSEELQKASSWQLNKLNAQNARWKVEELEKVYNKLFDIEVKMKSGGLMLPLKKHLDILLIGAVN